MFEKESEEFVDSKKSFWRQGRTCIDSVRQAYQKGAEFGYNKANEWYYPSKGEYPKECENVLCCCKAVDAKFYSIGHTIIGGDNKIRWWASNRPEELEVYAWKEIVLPEEIGNERFWQSY